jgi:alkylation response protein AidB-like acyl-CoA dehydrogenase
VDFTLTEEQLMLRDAVRKFCADHCGFEARRAAENSNANRSHWWQFAELGWLGLGLPEEVGGTAGSACEYAIIFQEFGRALVVEPFLSCMALAARIARAGRPDQVQTLLTPVVRGEMRIALAHYQLDGDHDVTAARSGPDTYVLNGRKQVVLDGYEAGTLLVSARLSDVPAPTDSLAVFIVNPLSEGVIRRNYHTLDGMRACDLVLDDVHVNSDGILGDIGRSSQVIADGIEFAMMAACAEMVGAMEGLLWFTRDYLRKRRQYGVALSSLQALQHRMAEMFAELELSWSMLYQGLSALDNTDAQARSRLVCGAKAYISSSARYLGETALQLHGGMGLVAEHKASHYFRRLITLASLFGTPDEHWQRLAETKPHIAIQES